MPGKVVFITNDRKGGKLVVWDIKLYTTQESVCSTAKKRRVTDKISECVNIYGTNICG